MKHFSVLTSLGLILALGAGCAKAARGSFDDSPLRTISIVIENRSGETVQVHFTRVGSTGKRLGRVEAMSRRAFRLPMNFMQGQTLLYSVPANARLDRLGAYTTLPFRAAGLREVRWVITDGQRQSDVAVR